MSKILDSFWSKVDLFFGITDEDCWNWIASTNHNGYGQFLAAPNKMMKAHRFIFQVKNGPIEEGFSICHKCDNPLCVNPSHLFKGTVWDNAQDSSLKGRKQISIHKKSSFIPNVNYNKKERVYKARVTTIEGKRKCLGSFKNIEKAKEAVALFNSSGRILK